MPTTNNSPPNTAFFTLILGTVQPKSEGTQWNTCSTPNHFGVGRTHLNGSSQLDQCVFPLNGLRIPRIKQCSACQPLVICCWKKFCASQYISYQRRMKVVDINTQHSAFNNFGPHFFTWFFVFNSCPLITINGVLKSLHHMLYFLDILYSREKAENLFKVKAEKLVL